MSRRYVIGVLVVSLLICCGWTLAQQAAPEASVPGGQAFAVSAGSDRTVLLDAKSGKTWVLHRSVDGDYVWLPVKRVDSEDEAIEWQAREKKLAEVRREERQAAQREAVRANRAP
jgi:hypothetical protein